MKKLSEKEFYEAPFKVQYVYMVVSGDLIAGSDIFSEVMEEHPEYFSDEIEYKEKLKAIPESVHEAYWKEYWKLDKEIYKDVPPSKGIVYWANHPEELEGWTKKWKDARKKGQPLIDELYEKFYSKYNLEKNKAWNI